MSKKKVTEATENKEVEIPSSPNPPPQSEQSSDKTSDPEIVPDPLNSLSIKAPAEDLGTSNQKLEQGPKKNDGPKENVQRATPGRIVTYFPDERDRIDNSDGKGLPAIVSKAKEGNVVSLQVFDEFSTHPRLNVSHKDNQTENNENGYWEWPTRF